MENKFLKNDWKPWIRIYKDGFRFGFKRLQILVGGKQRLGIWWLRKNNDFFTVISI